MSMRWPHIPFFSIVFVLLLASRSVSAQTAPGFEDLAKTATAAREANRSHEAIESYRRAVELRPDWEEGWWYLGTLQYDANHFAEAIPALHKVVELDPPLGAAWNFLGLCEFETRDYTNSLLHLQKGTDSGPGDDPELLRVSKYHLALLLIRNGEFEKGSKILSSSGVNNGSAQIKAAFGLSLLRAPLLPQEVDPSQEGLIQAAGEAAALLARDNAEKALASLQSLVREYPTTPYLHYAYGSALASAGQEEEALAEQRKEQKISPQSALVQIEISRLALRLHHASEALAAARVAVHLAPDSSAAYRVLGQSEQALGKTERAKGDLRKAETMGPEKPQPDPRVNEFYTQRTAAAATPIPEAKDNSLFSTEDADAVSRQAAAYQAAGNTPAAIRAYGDALKRYPDWEAGWWHMAMLHFESGHYPDATAALTTFVQRKPSDGTAWAVLGLSEFETKNYDSALVHLKRGQELGFGGSAESVKLASYRLAILLNRNSQFERAMELLASQARAQSLEKETKFALGMALLRMPLLPEQVEPAKRPLLQTAGEVAILLENSKYDDALPKLRSLIEQYPTVAFLHYAYGVALISLSQYENAAQQFRKEEGISPKSELPYLRLASIALRTSRANDAEPFAERAVKLAPDSGEAHYMLGRAYLSLGKQIAAIGELETAARISPSSPEVHFNLAKAYGKADLQDKEKNERAIFTRLNELAQQQRGSHGSQSYGAARDTSDFHVTGVEPASKSAESH